MTAGPAPAAPIGARLGILLCAAVGLAWWLVGSGAASNQPVWFLAGLAVAGTVAWSAKGVGGPWSRTDRDVLLATAAAIAVAAVVVLAAAFLGRGVTAMPVLALLLGVSLVPVRRWSGWRGWLGVGVGLVLAGVTGGALVLLGGLPGSVMLVTGGLCAIVLWVGGLLLGGAWRHADAEVGAPDA